MRGERVDGHGRNGGDNHTQAAFALTMQLMQAVDTADPLTKRNAHAGKGALAILRRIVVAIRAV